MFYLTQGIIICQCLGVLSLDVQVLNIQNCHVNKLGSFSEVTGLRPESAQKPCKVNGWGSQYGVNKKVDNVRNWTLNKGIMFESGR